MRSIAFIARLKSRMIQNEDGSSVVEFAVSLSLLLIMIFGIIELAMALYTYNFVAEAAREATRYASVRGSACTGLSNCPLSATSATASTTINSWVQSSGYPFAGSTTTSLTWSCSPTASPCNNPGNTVQVTVTDQYPLVLPFFPVNSITLKSTSQMVISQ